MATIHKESVRVQVESRKSIRMYQCLKGSQHFSRSECEWNRPYFDIIFWIPPYTHIPVTSCIIMHINTCILPFPFSSYVVRSISIIMLILFIAIATSCHPTLFKQCRVLSLAITEEGSSWLMKRLKKCSFLASVQQVIHGSIDIPVWTKYHEN